jgi:hypothetical protein
MIRKPSDKLFEGEGLGLVIDELRFDRAVAGELCRSDSGLAGENISGSLFYALQPKIGRKRSSERVYFSSVSSML